MCATHRNESTAADLSSSQVQGQSQSHRLQSQIQSQSQTNGVGGQSQRALFAMAMANGATGPTVSAPTATANGLIIYPCDASCIAPVGDPRSGSGRCSRGSNASNGSTRSNRSSHSGGALVVDVPPSPPTAAVGVGVGVGVGVNGVAQAACRLDLTTVTTQGVLSISCFSNTSISTLLLLRLRNVSELLGSSELFVKG